MHKIYSKWLLALAVIFNMSAAHSQWYIGVGAGSSSFDLPGDLQEIFGDLDALTDEINTFPGVDASFEVDDQDMAVKVFAGFQVSENLAFEFGYVDLGETTADFSLDSDGTSAPPGMTSVSSSIGIDGFNAGVVGILPLSDSLSLNGRAGMYYWDSESEFNVEDTTGIFFNDAFSESDDGNDVYYGVELDMGWLSLFYEIYDVDGEDVDLAGIAVKFGFDE